MIIKILVIILQLSGPTSKPLMVNILLLTVQNWYYFLKSLENCLLFPNLSHKLVYLSRLARKLMLLCFDFGVLCWLPKRRRLLGVVLKGVECTMLMRWLTKIVQCLLKNPLNNNDGWRSHLGPLRYIFSNECFLWMKYPNYPKIMKVVCYPFIFHTPFILIHSDVLGFSTELATDGYQFWLFLLIIVLAWVRFIS